MRRLGNCRLSTKRVPSVDAQSPQRTYIHKKGTQRGRAEPAEDFCPQKGYPAWTHRARKGLLSTKRVSSVDAQSLLRTSLHKKGPQCGRTEPTEDFSPQKRPIPWRNGPHLIFSYPQSILIIWLPEAPQSPILQQKQKSHYLRHICRRFLK